MLCLIQIMSKTPAKLIILEYTPFSNWRAWAHARNFWLTWPPLVFIRANFEVVGIPLLNSLGGVDHWRDNGHPNMTISMSNAEDPTSGNSIWIVSCPFKTYAKLLHGMDTGGRFIWRDSSHFFQTIDLTGLQICRSSCFRNHQFSYVLLMNYFSGDFNFMLCK